jgi:CRISPR-associated endonuclease/helicase Cas3
MTTFRAFFESLWKNEKWPKAEPFPWQTMLAERAASGNWPEAINLPTASGKTACLDAALFALACTANAPVRMPRRIWFVVDRRIVVDEAYERARQIATKLAEAKEGPVKEVAERLCELSGTDRPLAVARLRGGAWRDDGWARLPSQPAIICSTVDQVGSALLFRAYGHGDKTASIFAGLTAHDSLILLDEAHCAVPFLQTLRAVARYRGERWAAQPLLTPFRFSVMSATLPPGIRDIPEDAVFPKPAERAAALNHPKLQERFTARKIAEIVKGGTEEFVDKAASCARSFAEVQKKCRIAVMVNRVATAEQVAEHLRGELGDAAQTFLLTGRMRPLDRDALVNEWKGRLKAGSTEILGRPVIVVTTQCLEVGADFSFDALVTECASLDALRQRFGRLDRLGTLRESPAVILVREQETREPKDGKADPIYGTAIYESWKWLSEPDQQEAGGKVNFGIEAMDSRINALRAVDEERLTRLLAPTKDAPILLPAHLDLLCQTSQRTTPEPDITLFLHGTDGGEPEARVVLRADLPDPASVPEDEAKESWIETLSLVPPTSPEMFSVPLYRLRRWLREPQSDDSSGDVQGALEELDDQGSLSRPNAPAHFSFMLWRGRDRSDLVTDPRRIWPDDIVVLRSSDLDQRGLRGLGQTIAEPDGLGAERLDLAERALRKARGRVVLRLQADALYPLCEIPAIARLVDLARIPGSDDEIEAALDEIAASGEIADQTATPALPDWLATTIKELHDDRFRIEDHPAGGCVLIGRKEHREEETEDDPLADEEDVTSKWYETAGRQADSPDGVTLRQHTADLRLVADDFTARCLSPGFEKTIAAAAEGHDLGKLDRRFQIMLRNGSEDAVETGPPLAKSKRLPERRRRQIELREDAHLPKGFRHEFLSMRVADRFCLAPTEETARDLALHLIASHHGYARPFAPVVLDPLEDEAANLSLSGIGIDATFTATQRKQSPAYCLDSDVPGRFWRLTHRYGWWGLAYLEAIFRLADWQASRRPGKGVSESVQLVPSSWPPAPQPPTTLTLDALDGANPLAFLAALGVLRVLTWVFPEHNLRLSWEQRLGAWRPRLWATELLEQETILLALHENGLKLDTMFSSQLLALSEAAGPKNNKGEAGWKDKLKFPIGAFREFCGAASVSPSVLAEFAAAWAGETAPTGEDGGELARRTRFDFTAGNQAFIKMLRELRSSCTPEDLRRSLFTGWRYSATAISMRWDTQDEKRQYALQAVDPTNNSKNPPLADLGANFLAAEALPLFPLAPDRWASQAGFDRDAEGRCWRWPIWTCPLGLDTIRSLLTLPLADSGEWPASRRRAIGISIVFQSNIVQPSGRYRCFTPAQSL